MIGVPVGIAELAALFAGDRVIDDPIDAAESAVASDERTDAPLAKYAPDLAEVAQALPVEFLPPGLSHAALAVKTLLPESGAFDSL